MSFSWLTRHTRTVVLLVCLGVGFGLSVASVKKRRPGPPPPPPPGHAGSTSGRVHRAPHRAPHQMRRRSASYAIIDVNAKGTCPKSFAHRSSFRMVKVLDGSILEGEPSKIRNGSIQIFCRRGRFYKCPVDALGRVPRRGHACYRKQAWGRVWVKRTEGWKYCCVHGGKFAHCAGSQSNRGCYYREPIEISRRLAAYSGVTARQNHGADFLNRYRYSNFSPRMDDQVAENCSGHRTGLKINYWRFKVEAYRVANGQLKHPSVKVLRKKTIVLCSKRRFRLCTTDVEGKVTSCFALFSGWAVVYHEGLYRPCRIVNGVLRNCRQRAGYPNLKNEF